MATADSRPKTQKPKANKAKEVVSNAAATSSTTATATSSGGDKTFSKQLSMLRELFSATWNDDDLTSVLHECQGDLDLAIGRISEGYAEHWSTQSKKIKAKKAPAGTTASDDAFEKSTRSGRGEQSARGRGRGRGGRIYNGPSRRLPNGTSASGAGGASSKESTPFSSATTNANSNSLKPEQPDSGWATSASTDDWANASVAATVGSESQASTWDEPKSSVGWDVPATKQSASGGPVVSATPVAPVKKESKPPTSTINKKSTWAQIAKPEPPKPVVVPKPAAPVQPPREPSPKRSASPQRPASTAAATMDHGVTKSATVPVAMAGEKKSAAPVTAAAPKQAASNQGPPGFAAAARKTKPEAPVVMPTNASTVSNVGVKFGSLSLENELETKPKQAVPHTASPPSNNRTPVNNVAQLPQQQLHQQQQQQSYGFMGLSGMENSAANYAAAYGMGADYASLYADAQRGAQEANPQSSNPAAQQQQQPQGPGGYPMNAANLANMYAAYFPYYMNQFPGANPYGSSAPAAAGYGHHQPFAAPMNKGYPMYPAAGAAAAAAVPGVGGAPVPTATSQTPQQGAPKPVAASTAGIYGAGGYNPYGVAHQQQQHQQHQQQQHQQQQQQTMDDGSMLAGQDAYNKYQAFLGANQQGNTSKSNDYKEKQNMNPSAANAAYYGQFMHPGAQFPNYMAGAPYGGQQQMNPTGGARNPQQQQQQQQQPQQPQQQQYWGQ